MVGTALKEISNRDPIAQYLVYDRYRGDSIKFQLSSRISGFNTAYITTEIPFQVDQDPTLDVIYIEYRLVGSCDNGAYIYEYVLDAGLG